MQKRQLSQLKAKATEEPKTNTGKPEQSPKAEIKAPAAGKESKVGKRGKQKKPVKVPFLLKAEPEIMAQIENMAETTEQSKTAIIEETLKLFFGVVPGQEQHKANVEATQSTKPETQAEQTWCFSAEDLQEQARLIEKLTAENQRLTAELQLSKKAKGKPSTTQDFKGVGDLTGFTLILSDRNKKVRDLAICETAGELNEELNKLLNQALTNRERDNYEKQIEALKEQQRQDH